MSKIWSSLLLCHLFLFNSSLASTLATGNSGSKEQQPTTGSLTTKITVKPTTLPVTTTTQQSARGVVHEENRENAEIRLSQKESLEKPLPKKRGVMDELYRSQPGSFDETGYDTNEDAVRESFSGSRSDFGEKPFYKYTDSAFVNDDGYFESEGRSKRTADLDDLYGRQQEHEIELTPEEMMALLNLIEQSRAYVESHTNAWPHYASNVGSIQKDMRDEDLYRERPGKDAYEGLYENRFDSYSSRFKRNPTERRTRNSFLGYQGSDIPNYRRATL